MTTTAIKTRYLVTFPDGTRHLTGASTVKRSQTHALVQFLTADLADARMAHLHAELGLLRRDGGGNTATRNRLEREALGLEASLRRSPEGFWTLSSIHASEELAKQRKADYERGAALRGLSPRTYAIVPVQIVAGN